MSVLSGLIFIYGNKQARSVFRISVEVVDCGIIAEI